MKLRRHRGSYDESMATVVEIEPTRSALLQAIVESEEGLETESLTESMISVDHYGFESKSGWDAHLVTVRGWGIYGFTDGPLEERGS